MYTGSHDLELFACQSTVTRAVISLEGCIMATVDPIAAHLRRHRAVRVFLPLFFVSGATSLVYQTVWVRQLQLVFGTSTFAIATVLAAFMGGLAVGGLVMASVADDIQRPLRQYAFLECAIGLYALGFPALLSATTPLYLGAADRFSSGPIGFAVIQFGLVGALLILPTAFMGATLPLLARFAIDTLGTAGERVGLLYGVNTAGAVVGTWMAGFVLLPGLGLWRTTLLASGANVVLGISAFALSRWSEGVPSVSESSLSASPVSSSPRMAMPLALAVGLAGFASLVYEVAWTRVLGLLIGPTVYAFSVMLMAFLVGIAAGGFVGGRAADWILRRHGVSGVFACFAAVEIGVAGVSWLLIYLYPELPFWYVWLFDGLGVAERPAWMWGLSTLISGLVMTPPAFLMGAAFPMAVRLAVRGDRLGRPVGWLYGANTLGGLLGAAMGGFLLLPSLDVSGTLYVAELANLLAALVLVWAGVGRRARIPLVLSAGLVAVLGPWAPWDQRLMTSGLHHYVGHFEDHSRAGIQRFGVDSYELLYYREGLTSVVTVGRTLDSESLWLANNGKVDASAKGDGPTQVLCGLLALQFVESPRDVAVIGLASGVTAGALSLSPAVERLDIVEIEPAVLEASEFFREVNHDVLRDPRTRIVTNDARNHLLLTPRQTYDLVASEPSNPWITGVANLFTAEFFELGKGRLKPGGVWAQWLPTYGLGSRELRTLMRTFGDVFPYVVVYSTIDNADVVLLGSDRPLVPSLNAAERLFADPQMAAELRTVGITDAVELTSRFMFDQRAFAKMGGGDVRNTDDNMHIEYVAPLRIHAQTSQENVRWMARYSVLPWSPETSDALALADLARSYAESGDAGRTREAYLAAAARLPAGDPLHEEWTRRAAAVVDP